MATSMRSLGLLLRKLLLFFVDRSLAFLVMLPVFIPLLLER